MSEEAKRDPRIYSNRFNQAEYEAHRHIARIESSITRDHVLTPEFWSHVSDKITQWDEIVLCPDDKDYYARLLVVSCGSGWAKVHVLEWHDLNKAQASDKSPQAKEDDFEIVNKGGTRKHVVIRKSDQFVLVEGLAHKAVAQEWLGDYLKNPTQQPLSKAA